MGPRGIFLQGPIKEIKKSRHAMVHVCFVDQYNNLFIFFLELAELLMYFKTRVV